MLLPDAAISGTNVVAEAQAVTETEAVAVAQEGRGPDSARFFTRLFCF
jgi:hypothetical protein